ncbi:MAG TPA: GAF domain-containing protein, partial [Anaerolineae bacterium]
AIENAQLYEIERRRAQEMSIVAEINRTVSSSLDLDATLNSILASIRSLVPYDLAEINLWEAADRVLRTRGRGAYPVHSAYNDVARGVYHLDEGFTGWIARQRQPLLVADTQTSEIHSAIDPEKLPIRSLCGMPLVSGEELVGTLELASFMAGAFNETHLETIKTVAAQAAVAIENAVLFAETRRRVDESAALFRISAIAALALTPEEMLHELVAEIAKLMKAEAGTVLLYNPDTKFLEVMSAASFGAVPENASDFQIDTTHPLFHRSVFSLRQVFRSDDAVHDRRVSKQYRPFIQRFQIRALLAAPLVVRDRSIGEIFIARVTNPASFTDEDQQRLSTVLALLSNAIENARLYVERQQRLNELGGLYEISQAVGALSDQAEVYGQLTDRIAHLLGVELTGILLYAADQQALIPQPPFFGVPADIVAAYRIDLKPGGVARRIWETEKAWISNDVANEPLAAELGLAELAQLAGVRRTMMVPMTIGARRIGVIQATNKRDGTPFDQNDARLLSIYATQSAALVENARLFAETQRRLTQLGLLGEIGRAISSALHVDEVMDALYQQANRVLAARTLYIVAFDEALDEINFLRVYEDGEIAQLPEEDRRQRGGNTLTFYVCHNRKPLLLRGDVNGEARRLGINIRLIASGASAQTWMGVPM